MRYLSVQDDTDFDDLATKGVDYEINLQNQNSLLQSFSLYQTFPEIVGPSVDPQSLAWMVGTMAAGSTSNPSKSRFAWTVRYQALVGYVQPQGGSPATKCFNTASSLDVSPVAKNTLNIEYQGIIPQGVPVLLPPATKGTSGVIMLKADSSVPNASQQRSQNVSLNVGLAMDGEAVAITQLLPSLNYQFTPRPKYYIVSGAFTKGQIIDVSVTTDAFEIEFAPKVTSMTLIYTEDNGFEIG